MRYTRRGWPVLSANQVTAYPVHVAGREYRLQLRPGHTAVVLVDLVHQLDRIEPGADSQPDVSTFNPRPTRGDPNVWSEHGAGTALDWRSLLHPWKERGTWHGRETDVRALLRDRYRGLIVWGIDFPTPDEMHFEIGRHPGDPLIDAVAELLAHPRVLRHHPAAEPSSWDHRYETAQHGRKPGSRLLQLGCAGDDVAALQHGIGAHPDGLFGLETHTAVRVAQMRHQVRVTGVMDARTWTALGIRPAF